MMVGLLVEGEGGEFIRLGNDMVAGEHDIMIDCPILEADAWEPRCATCLSIYGDCRARESYLCIAVLERARRMGPYKVLAFGFPLLTTGTSTPDTNKGI